MGTERFLDVNSQATDEFIIMKEVADLIGVEKIIYRESDRLTPLRTDSNVSHYDQRNVPAIIRPADVQDVQRVAKSFNAARCRIQLQPISTGRNWGLGSSLPTQTDTVILDLGAIRAIRSINLDEGWAAIEPGVTQLELSRALEGSGRMLNVTASSGHTSVLGNALDRGVGLRRQRTGDLLGLEVVLPTGQLSHIGWWPQNADSGAMNSYGIGPSLLHLFTQSNFGLVTAGIVSLLPRPERQGVIRTSFATCDSSKAIDELREWQAQELISGVIKIYDRMSTASYGSMPGRQLVLLSVSGASEKVEAVSSIIQRKAASSGLFETVQFLDAASISENDTVTRVVERLFAGDPSLNETMLKAATGQEADRVDELGNGWIFFLPLIPFSGAAVERAYAIIESVAADTGVHPGTTVNALSSDIIDLVVSFRFQRTPLQITAARRALDLTYERFRAAGYMPYRLDIDHSSWANLAGDDVGRSLIRNIKDLIDPHHVIADGRYTPST